MTYPLTLVMKLASLAVHADELLFSGQGHEADKTAIKGILFDPEVKAVLADLERESLIPLRRDGMSYKEAGQ